METNRLVTIGALSERTEVNIETIRYYERIWYFAEASPQRGRGLFLPGLLLLCFLWSYLV